MDDNGVVDFVVVIDVQVYHGVAFIHSFYSLKKKLTNATSDKKWKVNSREWQESPAITDKPARRESLPTIAPIPRVYNVVADITGLSSFV